ncbi:hypothetical protein BD626DRAFT_572045 [Schizophyllum amplum]|uniref:TM7S3/TM198-like domain-containing protein n=1 Tax=Schizophyllum amplum TaxID=97359 RepID=A0A550C662_9AGAR|nr:hypothetical protein BD626DRAFT_572045 [Auriculariopsis ampla]
MRLAAFAIAALALFAGVAAQDDDNNNGSQSGTRTRSASASDASLSRTTSVTTITTSTRSGGDVVQTTFVSSSVYSVTVSATSSASATPSATESPNADNTFLDTKIDPAFGVLGALLILTGLPSTFWGHKNRWTSFFITGCYTLALVCFVLITKFGILPAIHPPTATVRGMFVLACGVAGIAGGGIAIFFWKASRYFIGGWGGFAVGLWIQCFRDGGLISNVGLRWILYIGAGVVGFVLCTIPKIHYHVLLVSTAFVGASAFMLGIDCFTTANLKEFYVWNIGFTSLFPKFKDNGIKFPVSQVMQIELGLIGAIALMGVAVQLRILSALQVKLKEINEEQRRRERAADLDGVDRFAMLQREQEEWERDHPSFSKHGRAESGLSTMPLMGKYQDGSSSPVTEHTFASEDRKRRPSGLSDLMASPAPEEEKERAARGRPTVALPALDLGMGIEDDVPKDFIAKNQGKAQRQPPTKEIQKRDDLLAEIDNLRRSIDVLRTESPDLSSHRPSLTSRRTLSTDAAAALLPAVHLRPPRTSDPRARVHSMEMNALAGQYSAGESLGRPSSAPLRDVDWDQYVAERKLLQPPSGVTPPIPTTSPGPSPTHRINMPPAVAEALRDRKLRESVLYSAPHASDDDVPLAQQQHARSRSAGGNMPVTILPPQKPIHAPKPQRPSGAPRTATFEELNERHREHLRNMQAPITQAQKDQADLDTAKARWERSKAAEREAVAKRQAEKAARLREGGRSPHDNGERQRRHSRSLSADKLNALGTGNTSKRLSTMKVENWQQQQVGEMGTGHERGPSGSGGRTRDSRAAGVPFPDTKRSRAARQ